MKRFSIRNPNKSGAWLFVFLTLCENFLEFYSDVRRTFLADGEPISKTL